MSTLKADTIVATDGSSPVTLTKQQTAKAFISFNGTGTVSTYVSFNISTLTDNDAADYSIAYTNNINTSNHPITASVIGSAEVNYYSYVSSDGVAQTTSGDTVHSVHNNGSTNNDQDPVHIVTHGDLA